jgi:uncharacterized protein (TIGR02285 family)
MTRHAWLRRTTRFARCCACSATLVGASALADTIVWVGTDFPPMAMSQGPYAHQGYIDAIFAHLRDSFPQHQFTEEIVPWPRALNMAQRGGPYCLISALQTPEREEFLRFSAPYGHLLPIGVVIRAADKARFATYITKAGDFQLAEALQQQTIGMGVAGSRSYGPRIDVLLKPWIAAGAKHVHRAHQDESTKYLMSMLERKRFDYMLAYPSEVEYYASSSTALHFYPIDGNNDMVAGRLSCAKSPLTDRVFAEVSAAVSTPRFHAVFLAAYERWLPKYLITPYRRRLQGLGGTAPVAP